MRSYRIGRAETNDIILDDPSVSREHAELTEGGPGLYSLRDLGSTYGTAIQQGQDWSLITTAEVRPATRIRIGEYETTVGELLTKCAPKPIRAPRAPEPAWAKPAPRLSDRARARHPATIHVTADPLSPWGDASLDGPPSQMLPAAKVLRPSGAPGLKRFAVSLLATLAVFAAVGLLALALTRSI